MTNFNFKQAMKTLGIKQRSFIEDKDHCRGYSHENWFAINPDEPHPEFVAFHEWTHILLGHTVMHRQFGNFDLAMHKAQYGDLYEAECHTTAIFAAILTGIPFDLGEEIEHLQRGYLRGRKLPNAVKARALDTAMQIAKAGGMQGVAAEGSGLPCAA